MNDKEKIEKKKIDTQEFKIPETLFIRDIEDKAFQSIVLQCLSQINGIGLTEGNFLDHLLGRSSEGIKGIEIEQDDRSQSVTVKVEVNIFYGVPIPEKADEIQIRIAETITELTGLHVARVHVIVKNVISVEQANKLSQQTANQGPPDLMGSNLEDEYTDEF